MELVISPDGVVRCVYGEDLNVYEIGQVAIRRASAVEVDGGSVWWADLSLVQGPKLGPFELRSQALAAESAWLAEHWLMQGALKCTEVECGQ